MYGQMRLQALLFWVRNPDYLANELIEEFIAGRMGPEALSTAESILVSDEPDLRRYPTIRWRFGAYEPVEDALSLLRSTGLIQVRRRGTPDQVRQHDYYLLEDGRRAADSLLRDFPVMEWYANRAALVGRVGANQNGTQLKDRQYLQWEYESTQLGATIAPIVDRVHTRLKNVRAA